MILAVLLVFSFIQLRSQDIQDLEITSKDSIVASSWIFGLGFNAVDDAGSEFSNVFNFQDNWNVVPFPSRLSIGRYFRNGLGLEAIGSFNRYQEGKVIDGLVNTEDIDYYAIDARVSYDLNKILGETGFFDPYVGIGAGFTNANNQGRGTYNAVVGFRAWINDNWGVDLNSSGKWTMDSGTSTNHIQHAAGVVYRFGIEKELSEKGKEKLALLEAMEKEQQRVNDSIAAAQLAEQEAKELAERLKREQEAAALAEAERKAAEAKRAKQEAIQSSINALGDVNFNLNSSYLTSNDKALLDNLIEILQENSSVVLEVTSHTDARGTDEYNLWLSERRLQRTTEYLLSNGIAKERIVSEAKGESELKNDCDDGVYCTEDKHRVNRRSEFTVVKF
ncbi:OmpA/MotB domain protein [Croceitalea dokdonensis DOKDO 023]|uniref:OmpA/MotB domain protein n=1 Tax=Croceitalea dokdonensis DOKDO 023 TaxID=1300341 RepID=A0A0P7ARC9_9FLAO|nr:OmpA/MotB domain protein [Croceitalea dokdonensis DOKDO 023]